MNVLPRAAERSFDAAFDELFRRARGMAYRLLGDPVAAEDVAAETLARAYARWSKVAGLPHRDRWVLRVAANLAIDQARRRVPRTLPPEPVSADEASTLRLALLAALRSLSKRQREVIVLRYLSDLSEADVAELLGMSVGAVKTHLHRGVVGLRSRLGEDFLVDFEQGGAHDGAAPS